MIVCSCNVIREADIRKAARAGHKDPTCAYASMGFTPQCGGCLDFARDLLTDESMRQRPIAA